jgi:hypothetical protein
MARSFHDSESRIQENNADAANSLSTTSDLLDIGLPDMSSDELSSRLGVTFNLHGLRPSKPRMPCGCGGVCAYTEESRNEGGDDADDNGLQVATVHF